jgi:uncharacterized protein YndB with AHSA1/START domain
MADILHRIGMEHASPEGVYDALTTLDGLSGWWTEDTTGQTRVGDVVKFRFGPPGGFDMCITELDPGRLVRWEVVDGPSEWVGTHVNWELRQDGDFTIVLFRHEGWREPVEFMYHCSTKWASFLLSLKQLVETGAGAPAPRDVQISDWH